MIIRENLMVCRVVLFMMILATFVVTGCDKIGKSVDVAPTIVSSKWEFLDTVDKMTGERTLVAHIQEKTPETPMVLLDIKLICSPQSGNGGRVVVASYLSQWT